MEDDCFITHLSGVFTDVLAIDLARYLLGAGGVYLVVNIALAARLRARKIRAADPPKGQIRREILASLRTVVVFAVNGTLIVLGAEAGVMPVYSDIAEYGWFYLVLSTLVLIVAHDAWFYWSHRLLHYPPLFRRFHRLHHRSHNPTPFTSYSFDLGEAIVNAVYLPLILIAVPAHPAAIVVFVTHMMLRNAIGHSGYELFPANREGRPLFDWLTTVTHHDLHHAHAGYNLGLYFTWWDRLMGTEHPEYYAAFQRVAHPAKAIDIRALGLVLAVIAGIGTSEARAADAGADHSSLGAHWNAANKSASAQNPAIRSYRALQEETGKRRAGRLTGVRHETAQFGGVAFPSRLLDESWRRSRRIRDSPRAQNSPVCQHGPKTIAKRTSPSRT